MNKINGCVQRDGVDLYKITIHPKNYEVRHEPRQVSVWMPFGGLVHLNDSLKQAIDEKDDSSRRLLLGRSATIYRALLVAQATLQLVLADEATIAANLWRGPVIPNAIHLINEALKIIGEPHEQD